MAMSGPTDPSSPSRSELECRQIAELLGEYLEGTLSKRKTELLEWHIDGCAPCVAFVNTYRGTVNATRGLRDVTIPPELKNRLLAVLRARQSE
jgi:hypothetical protein